MINDDQYLSELEAKNESQKGEIDLLQSDLKETRKMAQMARDTSANLTVTLEELRLKIASSGGTMTLKKHEHELQFLKGIIKELLISYDNSEVDEECNHDISERVQLLKELWRHGLLWM